MIKLKYATASQEVVLGPFIDDTDGKTPETLLTIANTDIKIWKSGATAFVNKNSGGATHMANGVFYCVLDATDTNTYGPMFISVQMSGALAVVAYFEVVNPDAYNAMFAANGTGFIETNVVQVSGDATAANNLESDYDGTGYNKSNSTVGTVTTNTDMVAEAPTAAAVADAVWDEAKAGHVAAGSFGEEVQAHATPAEVASELATYDAPTKAEMDAGFAGQNDISTADVAAELATYDGPTKAELDAGLAALNDPTAAAIADAVWDEAKAGHVAVGSFGEEVQAHALSSEISALENLSAGDVATQLAAYDGPTKAEMDAGFAGQNDISIAQVGSEVATQLASYDGPTKAELDAGLAALNDPTAAAIADAVWEEAIADHSGTAGSTAEALDNAGGGSTPAAIADAVWDELKSGHVVSGSFGEEVQAHATPTEVNAEVDTAIADAHLDHLLQNAYDPASKPGNASGLLNILFENDGGVPRYTANALELAPTGGANPNVLIDTTIATVNTQQSFTLTSGSDVDDAYNEQAIVLYDASNGDYPSVHVITDYVGSTKTVTIDSAPVFTIIAGDGVKTFVTAPGTTAPTADQVADAVWDEATIDHQTTGTFGERVQISGGGSSSAISTAATSYLLTTGTQSSGTYTDAAQLDGVMHQHTDSAGAMDLYYEFGVGSDGYPVGVEIHGYVSGGNDWTDVYAYNWAGTAWQQVGTIIGQNGTTVNDYAFSLLDSHVGTGANLGKVRIRFYVSSGLTTSTLSIDQILCSYVVVNRSIGYEGGAVWIDTNGSNSGTESFVDGTADNPVNSLAAATTIAGNIGLKSFHLVPGTSVILGQAYDGYRFDGQCADIDLNGQSISGAIFSQCHVTGSDAGTQTDAVRYLNCEMNGITIGISVLHSCRLASTMTLQQAGDFFFDQCYSAVAGTGTPALNVGAAIGNTNISFRHYSGGIEVQQMNATGSDTMSLEGYGQLVLNASCVGGTIAIRGNFTVTDNAGGAVTLSDNARWAMDQEAAALETYDGPTKAEMDAGFAGQNDISIAQVGSQVATELATYDGPTKAEMDASFAALNDPTAAAIADAVWEEPLVDHSGSGGSTAEALDSAAAGGSVPTVSEIADAVWDELKAGHVVAGSFGEEVQAHALTTDVTALNDPTVAAIAAEVWSAATRELTAGTKDTEIDSILTAVTSGGVSISTATMQAIAGELLKLNVDTVEDSASANSLAALILATFFGAVAGGTMTIYKTDGVTTFATTSVTTDAAADPIVSVGV